MKLHAFLATAADLAGVLRAEPDARSATLLSGADPANLSSLFELVTRGALTAEEALAELDHPVAQVGPDGPWAYAVPAVATAALAEASAAELDQWTAEWAGHAASPTDSSSVTVHALAALAARATPDQALYVRLASPDPR